MNAICRPIVIFGHSITHHAISLMSPKYPSLLLLARGSYTARRHGAADDAFLVQEHRKSLATTSPMSHTDLMKQLDEALFGNLSELTARNGLQSRVDTLRSLGCTDEDLLEYPELLKLTEMEVINRAQHLKKQGMQFVSGRDLLTTKLLAHFPAKQQKPDSGLQREKQLCNLLQCSSEQLKVFQKENPNLDTVDLVVARKSVRLLQSYGATLNLLKENPFLLTENLRVLQRRLSVMKEVVPMKPFRQKHIDLLAQNEFNFSIVRKALANILEVENVNISEKVVLRLKPSEDKIAFLLEIGYTKPEIANTAYILRHGIQKIKDALESCKSVNISRPSLFLISYVIQNKHITPVRKHGNIKTVLSNLLDVPCEVINPVRLSACLMDASSITICRNYSFLRDQGFTDKEIFSCTLILVHDVQVLESYFNSLSSRDEVLPYLGSTGDKCKLINCLQYFIEHDVNFQRKELNQLKLDCDDVDDALSDSEDSFDFSQRF